MVDLLTENITAWKDIGEVQNQSVYAKFGDRDGLIVLEFAVPAIMNREGQTTDLDAGTYYLPLPFKVANAHNQYFDNFYLPAGLILTEVWTHTHVAVAGVTATITPKIGSDSLTNISAAGTNDDTAALAANLLAADSDISFVVNTNPVTAGAFTIFIKCLLGNV